MRPVTTTSNPSSGKVSSFCKVPFQITPDRTDLSSFKSKYMCPDAGLDILPTSPRILTIPKLASTVFLIANDTSETEYSAMLMYSL